MGHSQKQNRHIRGCHACSRSAIWLWEQAGLSFQYIELLKTFPLWNEWTQQFFTKSMKWANYRTSNWCQTIRVDKSRFICLFVWVPDFEMWQAESRVGSSHRIMIQAAFQQLWWNADSPWLKSMTAVRGGICLWFLLFSSPVVSYVFGDLFRVKDLRTWNDWKLSLDELYEDLWEEQPGTVNQYAARLHHLGMSEVEVLVQVQEMRRKLVSVCGTSYQMSLPYWQAVKQGWKIQTFMTWRKLFGCGKTPLEVTSFAHAMEDQDVLWLIGSLVLIGVNRLIICLGCTSVGCSRSVVLWRCSGLVSIVVISRSFFFMSFFVRNQHRIFVEEYVSDLAIDVDTDTRLAKIGQLVTIIDTWKNPINFSRPWCVYELFVAAKLDIPITIVTAKEDLDSLRVAMQHERGLQDVAQFLVWCEFTRNRSLEAGRRSKDTERHTSYIGIWRPQQKNPTSLCGFFGNHFSNSWLARHC